MRILVAARNTAVGIEAGRIVEPDGRFDLTLRIPDGDLRPGLINGHDHLHRNHYGRLGMPPYRDAYEWGRDIHTRYAAEIVRGRAVARRDALRVGAWKNLVAGVTTVVHHDRPEPEFEAGFPLRVARVRCAHSLGFERELRAWQPGPGPRAIHLAEGVDADAAAEIGELDALGALAGDLMVVHVVGVDAPGVDRLREAGVAIVWCPTSNLFLFGRTVPTELLAPGADVLLGTDSLLTGEGTLLDELRRARSLGLLSDQRLLDAVGRTAARRLGLAEPSLAVGAPADLAVFRRPVLEAAAADVAAVFVGGVPRVLDPALAPLLGELAEDGRRLTTMGVTRWVYDGVSSDHVGGLPHETRPVISRRRRPW